MALGREKIERFGPVFAAHVKMEKTKGDVGGGGLKTGEGGLSNHPATESLCEKSKGKLKKHHSGGRNSEKARA